MTADARDDARSTKPVRIPSLRPPTGPLPVTPAPRRADRDQPRAERKVGG